MRAVPALFFKQLKVGPMDNFVYLLGAEGSPEVAVVDPAWEIDTIEQAAAADGKQIVCAVVSHCHHDHTNGLPELLKRHDIPVYAQKAELEFSADLRRMGDAMKPAEPGQVIHVGPLDVKLLHTPGHTPGSHCLWVEDALVSGDTVFVNACGRCDLKGGDPDAMFRSISQVLMKLPPQTRLLPGHDYGDVPISSIARESEQNPYFQHGDLDGFIRYRMRPRR
jgi:hydroxyacylglutathione hydrolase